MKPLTLQEIADILDLHVSTISRTISHKYLQTDFGILRVKYLLQREARKGEGVARVVVKQYVQEIIADEDQARPLSDEKNSQETGRAVSSICSKKNSDEIQRRIGYSIFLKAEKENGLRK